MTIGKNFDSTGSFGPALVSLGAEVDIVGYLVSRYFGLRRYGEIYGYIFAIFTIGSGVGPYLIVWFVERLPLASTNKIDRGALHRLVERRLRNKG